jgi:hypothetical protein
MPPCCIYASSRFPPFPSDRVLVLRAYCGVPACLRILFNVPVPRFWFYARCRAPFALLHLLQ